jgi:hypothetical protein
MLASSQWAELIPHAGAMRLLDAVVDWNMATIHAIGERHGRSDHPLCDETGLHAMHLAEYGAQAAAVHGALLAVSCSWPSNMSTFHKVAWTCTPNACLPMSAVRNTHSRLNSVRDCWHQAARP